MGLDRLFTRGDGAQFGAHALDMAVDVALVARLAGHAEGIEQLLARIDPAWLAEQRAQQAKFVAGQAQGLAMVVNAKGGIIDLKGSRRAGCWCFTRRHAFEDGLDPGGDLTRAEGFDHVVVGADFQTHHAVDLLAARGEEDHR